MEDRDSVRRRALCPRPATGWQASLTRRGGRAVPHNGPPDRSPRPIRIRGERPSRADARRRRGVPCALCVCRHLSHGPRAPAVGRWRHRATAVISVFIGTRGPRAASVTEDSYLVDPASSHMLVSKIKPCMCKYKLFCTVKLRMAH